MWWKALITDEAGLETVEYALMTALIVLAIAVALGAMLVALINGYAKVSSGISGVGS